MLKFTDTLVGFSEIPNEITLCINISGCPHNCDGCHSEYLKQNIGEELTNKVLGNLVKRNEGITCICLMGGDCNLRATNKLMLFCREEFPNIKRAIYLGSDGVPTFLNIKLFDFIKIGPYLKECGPINNPNTNQRLYKVDGVELIDITNKFWK